MTDRIARGVVLLACGAALGAGVAACGSGSPAIVYVTTQEQSSTVTVPAGVGGPTTTVPAGPENVALEPGAPLASASSTLPGTIVDGIQCSTLEQLAYRAHVHLQVYVDGRARALPGAIGMLKPNATTTPYGLLYSAGECYYWLHTYAADGIIHVDSPVRTLYTLGDFFAVWDQPLSSHAVAGAVGPVTAVVDGHHWRGSVAAIPLREHTVIELAVGRPIPPFQPFDWTGTNL